MQRAAEIAWAAGLFEGEGCVSASNEANPGPRPGPKTENRRRIRLQLAMTDQDTVERFHQILGVGYVKKYTPKDGVRKPFWQWMAHSKADVTHVIELLMPWMMSRRKAKMEEALAVCAEIRDGWATRRERYGHTGHTGYKKS